MRSRVVRRLVKQSVCVCVYVCVCVCVSACLCVCVCRFAVHCGLQSFVVVTGKTV